MVPDMMAVYHLQKNKGTGVCALIWKSQITPIRVPQNFEFPFKLKPQRLSEVLRGQPEAFGRINID